MKYKILSNGAKFNGVYSRKNLPEIKVGTYGINLDKYKSLGNHRIALYVNSDNVKYIKNFGVKSIKKNERNNKGIKKFIDNKNITTSIYRIQANVSVICRYFFTEFIDLILKGLSLLDYTSLFSPKKVKRTIK